MSNSMLAIINQLTDKLAASNRMQGVLAKRIHKQRLQMRKLRNYNAELLEKVRKYEPDYGKHPALITFAAKQSLTM